MRHHHHRTTTTTSTTTITIIETLYSFCYYKLIIENVLSVKVREDYRLGLFRDEWPPTSVTRFGEILPPKGNFLKIFGNFLRAYLVWGKILNLLYVKKICCLAKLSCCKWPTLKTESSHLVTLPPTEFCGFNLRTLLKLFFVSRRESEEVDL